MSITSVERREALDAAAEGYQNLVDYVDEISEEDMLRPNTVGVWSGKDLLCHIANWEEIIAGMIKELEAGRPEVWMPEEYEGDFDRYNLDLAARHQDDSLSDCKAYLAASHEKLMTAFEETTTDRLDLLSLATVDHYREHYPDFRNCKPFKPLNDEDRAALIGEMQQSKAELDQLLDSIPQEAMLQENTVGIWSGKDLVTHLGHWQQAAMDLTANLEAGQPGKWPGEDGSNIDEWNQEHVLKSQDLTLEESRAYLDETFNVLVEMMRASPKATRGAGIGATQFHYGLHKEDFASLTESEA